MAEKSFMRQEIEQIPQAVSRLLSERTAQLVAAGAVLRERDPVAIVTIARGSSDHAATFLKYAIELTAGVPVASLGPSVMSIYHHQLKLDRCAAVSISQSGKSPDIVATAEAAKRGGAYGIAITNTPGAPLGDAADITIDLAAGVERSVAATKTFVNSVVAGLALLAEWQDDHELRRALAALPDVLQQALDCDWTALLEALDSHQSLYVLGRGPAMAIASEAALKFKETCGIHAEAYSSAEVIHGPARIVERGFPVLALVARDAAEASVAETLARFAGQGALCFTTGGSTASANHLPHATASHPLTDALALVVSFYGFVEALSRRRGFDPDRPPHLKKVTETT